MTNRLYESEIEQIALDILRDENGYAVSFGPELSEGNRKEREYTEVVLQGRLRDAIDRLNQGIPAEAREEAAKKALRTVSINLLENNEAFHRMLTDGIDVKFSIGDGKTKTDKVWLVDFVNPENNEFLAVKPVHGAGKPQQQTSRCGAAGQWPATGCHGIEKRR